MCLVSVAMMKTKVPLNQWELLVFYFFIIVFLPIRSNTLWTQSRTTESAADIREHMLVLHYQTSTIVLTCCIDWNPGNVVRASWKLYVKAPICSHQSPFFTLYFSFHCLAIKKCGRLELQKFGELWPANLYHVKTHG